MGEEKLKKLEEVLIGLGPGKKIIDHKTTKLTAPGQNYGSLMLAVDVDVLDERTNSEETLHLVGKLLPTNEMAKEVFNVQVTFRNEAGVYKEIVPLLEKFQQENGTCGIGDYFAKFFGARASLDSGSGTVDENAVILLENLKLSDAVVHEMGEEKLKKLEEVLLDLGPGKKIIDHKTARLTAPGQNYGSVMLAVDVDVLDERTNSQETLHLVGKLLPMNEMTKEMFNVQVTFRNEVGMYQEIVPLLEKFQRENGTNGIEDYFARFFGARVSLDSGSDIVDENAVLLLENLKILGFTTVNRAIGLDLESARLILKSLAIFHATSLSFKLKNPEEFEKKIKCYLVDFQPIGNPVFTEQLINSSVKILKENPKCVPHLDRVTELLKQGSTKDYREPFATISHNDFWTNNVMLKFENGNPVANKFVDFQVIEYKSPCRDLIFLLFSSVRLDILTDGHSIDELLDLYYETFIEELKKLKCEVTPFNREFFNKEIELASKESEYFHIIIMHNPIYASEEGIPEYDADSGPKELQASAHHKERVQFITLEFAKRGWL